MAQCLDIRREGFGKTDRFLLDTNVAFDLVSPFGRPADSQRSVDYGTALAHARRAGAECVVSVLTFFELAGIFERDRYESVHGTPPATRAALKEFRKNAKERARYVREFASAWQELASLATVAAAELAAGDALATYLPLLRASSLDGYDPGLVAEARRHRISTIVTHDADFATVPDLIVLTANARML